MSGPLGPPFRYGLADHTPAKTIYNQPPPGPRQESIENQKNIIKLLKSTKVCIGIGSVSSDKFVNIKSTFGSQFVESFGQ